MKIALTSVVVIALVAALYFTFGQSKPTVFVAKPDSATLRKTTGGTVLGYTGATGTRIWQGIRYARAPKGTLRWRAPLPPKAPRKGGIVETLGPAAACPQLPSLLSSQATDDAVTVGDEDCLFLNIYAPPEAESAPVMFWLHGGGNSAGKGSSYSGENLAHKHGVVVVTINYRLGLFGWFSHPSLSTGNPADDSGNYGTLDVVRGLQWVRENIAAFGGDPANVTVFGESAGGSNTLAMLASPLAKGLFHRAIVQSGGFATQPLESARNPVAQGGHRYSSAEIVKQLLVADGTVSAAEAAEQFAEDMSRTELRQYLYGKKPDDFYALFNGSALGMVDLPSNFGDGYVLPDMPTEEIFSDAANYNQMPVILGTNRDEPSLFMFLDTRHIDFFLGVLPRFKDEQGYLQAVKYGALSWKLRGVDSIARAMTASGNSEVFAYRFDWDEEPSRLGFDLSKALGAAHGLEIPFVFDDFENTHVALIYPDDDAQFALADSISAYWTQFAATGDPGQGQQGSQVPWLAWGTDGKRSIILDSPADQGVYMDDSEVTLAGIKAMLASDEAFVDETLRCHIYVRNFRGENFVQAEYDNLSSGVCRELDPSQISFF